MTKFYNWDSSKLVCFFLVWQIKHQKDLNYKQMEY